MLKIVLYQLFIRNWIANFSSISKKYIKFLFPPSFSALSARRAYVIQIAVRACVPLSKSHSQMDARPLDLPPFLPP